ncbi:MAG: hypothetical protein GWM88_05300, partial [Pseudomonadales bacterium]|nr:hypothetical protein [Pseudomonadales bacterium]NIX07452.1 hypothetical protein [Pseudomonadales bacterium]
TEWILHAPELKKGAKMPGAQIGGGGMAPTGLSREQVRAVAAYLLDLRRPMAGRRGATEGTAQEAPVPAPGPQDTTVQDTTTQDTTA